MKITETIRKRLLDYSMKCPARIYENGNYEILDGVFLKCSLALRKDTVIPATVCDNELAVMKLKILVRVW